MKLSPCSRRIALFDSPVEVTRSYTIKKRGKSTEFRQFSIPPFEYEVSFRAAPGESYIVSFALTDIRAEGEELASTLSRILGREISVRQAPFVKRQFNPTGVLNTGNASQVLAAVVRIIREFVEERKPSCLALNALEKSRRDLYRRMVRSIARGAQVEETKYGFQVCFPPEKTERKTALRLTSSYRTVTAVLDTPVKYESQKMSRLGRFKFTFTIDPFSYSVFLVVSETEPDTVEVSFNIDPTTLTPDSLMRHLESKGKSIDPEGVEFLRLWSRVTSEPFPVLGVGQAYQVLSHVIGIVKDFVQNRDQIRCAKFSVASQSRVGLYTSLIRRFFPESKIRVLTKQSESMVWVCRAGGWVT